MKIVASAWMKLQDGTTAFEEYGFVESVEELNRFKRENDDDVFDIVFTYHHIPNDTDYEHYYYNPDLLETLVCDNQHEIDENTALLMLSTVSPV
ncbi:hypothetical protein [Escherichia phage BF17]|nr:hypothetical protein [Escherichia phage BF17]